MKRLGILFAAVLMCACLFGCKSKEAKSVDGLIAAIGEVNTDSGPVIAYVREACDALSEEDRQSLENYSLLIHTEATYVDLLIDAVGTVTTDSGAKITAAEEALKTLGNDAAALVAGVQDLEMARASYDMAVVKKSLSGVWVNEFSGAENSGAARMGRGLIGSFGLDETNCDPVAVKSEAADGRMFELREDGTLLCNTRELGSWEVSEDGAEVVLKAQYGAGDTAEYTLQVQEESGYTKLVGGIFENQPFGYVKEQDYAGAFEAKYGIAELSRENVHSYVGDPVLIGKLTDPQEKKWNAYVYPSMVYEEGQVYFGSSCVIQVDYVHGGKKDHFFLDVPVMYITKLKMKDVMINTDVRLSGEIYYVKQEYVADNYINEAGFRVLELTNGVSVVFDGYDDTLDTFWSRVEADYSDYIY